MTDPENNQTLSEDDNTSCSNRYKHKYTVNAKVSTHLNLVNFIMIFLNILFYINSEMSSEVYNSTGQSTPSNLSLNNNTTTENNDNNNSGGSSRRKNKRKNFMPRNIMEYAGSDEDEDHPNHKRNASGPAHNNNNNLDLSTTRKQLTTRSRSQRDDENMDLSIAESPENDDEDTEDDEGDGREFRINLPDSHDTPLDLSEVQNGKLLSIILHNEPVQAHAA